MTTDTTPNPASSVQTPTDASTIRSPASWLVMLAACVLGLAADLSSKYWAFREVAGVPVTVDREAVLTTTPLSRLIPPHPPVVVVPNLLEFTLVLNPGAVFGIGAGKRVFFIVVTVMAIALAMWMFARWTRAGQWVLHAGIGLLIAGAIGNLYDRIVYACVRDFIHPLPGVKLPFGWTLPNGSREVWPYVSNIADLFLLVAIGILLVHSWRSRGPAEPAEDR
jgi:signal peptidase II